ncbi:laminin subunit alpha-like [Pararge aegeria]|uniref:laminin subunit alpha-like n=1 Tax=Pararge aegeria TaxID=116150 RepID=UPI0019CF90A7|nr:laminin subunit alpha-like [Pararge aegeria]
MFLGVTFLVLLTRLPYEIHSLRSCVPNTYFALNDRLCWCDLQGRLNEANCKTAARRQPCPPGQVIWQGCNQCICQNNGQLKCTSAFCSNWVTKPGVSYQGLTDYGSRCTPFKSYYVNCSLCYCPASGYASDAQCAVDASCTIDHTSDVITLTKQNQCIPNVMYLLPCVQCLCSEKGYFAVDKCLEKCQPQSNYKRRCIPGTLYRKECDVCRCPDNSIPDEKLCIKNGCDAGTKEVYLHPLRSSPNHCTPHAFTEPKCIYCDCSLEGTVNEHSCLELNCSKISDFKYYVQTDICSPGELVPICMQCFCPSNRLTNETYCTRVCTDISKLNVIEKVLNDSKVDLSLIDKKKIKIVGNSEGCEPSTLYLNNGKYCLCPDNGETNLNFCTQVIEEFKYDHLESSRIKFDSTTTCDPSTLVDFGCNTCYCSKAGKIDPKWCTYDDCEAKRIVMESHKSHLNTEPTENPNGGCTPGSISKVKCNFCICPESGILKERVCTKNDCFEAVEVINVFVCEPLAYYEVDCNICFCPLDGLKNVAKCTKNACEKSFLRSDACGPGHLFSDGCNVCVCPPDGNKANKVCTNNTCSIPRWSTYKLTDSLLENQIHDDATRNLDLCFPGEEFSMGCNICVCPDLGLKVYAICEPLLCDANEDIIKAGGVLDRSERLVCIIGK